MRERGLFEPRDWLDRVVYAGLAVTGFPTACEAHAAGLDTASAVLALWTVIAAFWTIDWALVTYRKFRGLVF